MVRLIFIFFMLSSVHAAIPTTEGLFRNGGNADVTASLVVLKLQVSEEPIIAETEEIIPRKSEATGPLGKSSLYQKFLISVNDEKRVELLQVSYKKSSMHESDIVDVRYFSNLSNKVLSLPAPHAIFYALISHLVLNRSIEMSHFLKKVSKNYKTNKELLDEEKVALYEKYKRYLSLLKEDSSLKETMEDPLSPREEEVAATVNQIKARPFMKEDQSVSLQRSLDGFYWNVDLDVLNASFDEKSLRIKKLEFGEGESEISFAFNEFILFDGNHELPKFIKIKSKDALRKLRVLNLTHMSSGNKSIQQRYEEYQKLWEKFHVNNEAPVLMFPL